MKIYLASSWRNEFQPAALSSLRNEGHEVYDFRNPGPEDKGFGWSAIDPNWKTWGPKELKSALANPIAMKGHTNDHKAMRWADACVLLLGAGPSAHLEAGLMAGWGKLVLVYAPEIREPDLMYLSLNEELGAEVICLDMLDLLDKLKKGEEARKFFGVVED